MIDIADGVIAVATVWLDDVRAEKESVLSSDERARAATMRDPTRRARFVAARASLRAMLAAFLDVEPAALVFDYGASGKPLLRPANELTCASLPHFSVTHSDGLALIAVTYAGPVGIDLELMRAIPRAEGIARRVIGEAAATTLAAMRGEERDAHFLWRWTRREAAVKATGTGIWRSGTVTTEPAVTQEPHVQSIAAAPRYVAAVAVLGAVPDGGYSVERFALDAGGDREPERV